MWAVKHFHPSALTDAFRGLAVAEAVGIILLMLFYMHKFRHGDRIRGDRYWCYFEIGYSLLVIFIQWGRFGKPVLWWFLPLVLIINIFAVLSIIFRIRTKPVLRDGHS